MTVTSPESRKIYFGLTEGKWKKKYYNHKSFNNKRYSHGTTLWSYLWHLKETLDVTPNLKRSVVRCATPHSNISKKCPFCFYEELVINTYPRQYELLKNRSEKFSKYCHENYYLLKILKVNDKRVIKYSQWRSPY